MAAEVARDAVAVVLNRGSLTTLADAGLSSGTSTTEILLCARWPCASNRTHSLPYCDIGITVAVYDAT